MARNHGDIALPHSGISNAIESIDKKYIARDDDLSSMPTGYSSAGGEIGAPQYNQAMSIKMLRKRKGHFKPLKTMMPPVGIIPDLLVMQNLLIDLAKVTLFSASVNTVFAWAYCIRHHMTFDQAWDDKTARQLSALFLIMDLLFIIVNLSKGIRFSLSEGISVARRANLSVLGTECKIPARPTKVRKSMCPPDPCPFDEDEGFILSSDSEAEARRHAKPHTSGKESAMGLEQKRGNVHKEAHDSVVMREMAKADLAMSSIPTGVLIEEDNRQLQIQERMKKIINLENSREGIQLTAREKDTLKRIMDTRQGAVEKAPYREIHPHEGIESLDRRMGKDIDDFHDIVEPEETEDKFDSTASDDMVKKRRKYHEKAAIPISYIIFTISMLMLASIVAAMVFIPDLDEWLRWLWEIIEELFQNIFLFLRTDAGKALLATLTLAVAGACLRGARQQPPGTIKYNAEGPERVQVTSDNLKDGLKESIKISYQETIPDDEWNKLRQ